MSSAKITLYSARPSARDCFKRNYPAYLKLVANHSTDAAEFTLLTVVAILSFYYKHCCEKSFRDYDVNNVFHFMCYFLFFVCTLLRYFALMLLFNNCLF